MSELIHDIHPMKVHVESFGADGTLKAEDGWVDMNVKFLITRDSVNAQQTVFGITVFPPGSKHDIHRHPHAEETEYIVEGHGIARVGEDDVSMGPGDIVFGPTDAVPRVLQHVRNRTSRDGLVLTAVRGRWRKRDIYVRGPTPIRRSRADDAGSRLSRPPRHTGWIPSPNHHTPNRGTCSSSRLWCGICGTDLARVHLRPDRHAGKACTCLPGSPFPKFSATNLRPGWWKPGRELPRSEPTTAFRRCP